MVSAKLMTDSTAAVDFLRWWAPNGPWVLTAIEVDQKSTRTETFDAENQDRLKGWVEEQNNSKNIYFHVNPVRREVRRKVAREDLAAMAWIHVDIDPRASEDLDIEQERILGLLRAESSGAPPPSAIVFSGGGFQAFWRLQDPIILDGDVEKAESAKRYNLRMEQLFGGDNCHDVSRIMRLPGTINWPTEKKRRKGRKPALAIVVEVHDDRVYPISVFTPAPEVQGSESPLSGGGSSAISVTISGNVPKLDSVEVLGSRVSDKVKILIEQGTDPDDPTKYTSDSEAVFAVVCELVRAEVSDDMIFAVITDPDFPISRHILKQPRPNPYAIRQIRRAKAFVINPKLELLNRKHAVIEDAGGKCKVISESFDPALKRPCLTFQSFPDFRNRYLNDKVQVGETKNGKPNFLKLGDWWLEHPSRRSYETITFAPGQDIPNAYNLWRGFNCEAIPGDCSFFLEHVLENICGGDELYFDYLVKWMARAVQKPDAPGYTAIVLRGDQGTGKSFFAKEFGALFGHHFVHISDPNHFTGRFNEHLRDAVVVFADEAFYAGDKSHASILKTIVTEEVLMFEAKYMNPMPSLNCIHLIMASNEAWVVPAGVHERRFLVLEVHKKRQDDRAYFRRIKTQMDSGGREALLDHLLRLDLSEFDVRQVPKTIALRQQQMFSMGPEEEWWYSKLVEGRTVYDSPFWERYVPCVQLQFDFLEFCRIHNIPRRMTPTKLTNFLKKVTPAPYPRRIQLRGTVRLEDPRGREVMIDRPQGYEFPPLETMREFWDRRTGGRHDWPEPLSEREEMPPPSQGLTVEIPF